nr:MAG TPA: hypothetical protein [Caudoviricetes sp.]
MISPIFSPFLPPNKLHFLLRLLYYFPIFTATKKS